MSKINNIVVTGANGFIGTAVVSDLVKHGYFVTAICHTKKLPIESKNLIQFQVNLLDKNEIQAVKGCFNNADTVIHLAGYIPKSGAITKADCSKNLLLDKRLIGLLKHDARFIFASSVDVYSVEPKIDTNSYGFYKLESEKLFQKYFRGHEKNLCVLRLTHTYGPGDTSEKIIPKLISSTLKSQHINLFGVENRRDFLFIDDLCNVFREVVGKQISGIHNVSSRKMISIKELQDVILNNYQPKLTKSIFAENNVSSTLKLKITPIQIGMVKTKEWIIIKSLENGGCIIFSDLDGVILDNKNKYFSIHQTIVKKISNRDTKLSARAYWKLKRSKNSVEKILELDNISKEFIETYRNDFRKLVESAEYLKKDKVINANIDVLRKLAKTNKMFLITLRTNKKNTLSQLTRLGLGTIFDKIIFPDNSSHDNLSKTNAIKEYIDVNKVNILITDTENDIRAAKEAGIGSIGLSCGIRSKKFLTGAGADIVSVNLNSSSDNSDKIAQKNF